MCVCVCVTHMQVFAMSPAKQRKMQESCRKRAKVFEYERFEDNFHHLVKATQFLKPDLPWSAERLDQVRN